MSSTNMAVLLYGYFSCSIQFLFGCPLHNSVRLTRLKVNKLDIFIRFLNNQDVSQYIDSVTSQTM